MPAKSTKPPKPKRLEVFAPYYRAEACGDVIVTFGEHEHKIGSFTAIDPGDEFTPWLP
jgi:hypothetical protein